MEKILLAVDAAHIDKNTLDFACYIAGLTHSKLTGIFLENIQERQLTAGTHVYSDGFSGIVIQERMPEMEEVRNQFDANILLFKETCAGKNISCYVHRDRGVPVNEIINETRFADLLIMDARISFATENEASPSGFAKKVLSAAECPVMIAPDNFKGIDEILFTYDGSASSVFAIKQFTYLFSELDEKNVTLLQVNEDDERVVENRLKIAEWLQVHFSAINIVALNGKMKNTLFSYLIGKKNLVVVMGAYGRSSVSQFFKSSSADPIIKAVNLPVFIAHH